MNIYTEFGNSTVKSLLTENGKNTFFNFSDFETYKKWSNNFNCQQKIIFTNEKYMDRISELNNAEIITKKSIKHSVDYCYNMDELGIDRLLLVEYAARKTDKSFIIFSFGTCFTVNIVKNKVFRGGVIIPSSYELTETIRRVPALKTILDKKKNKTDKFKEFSSATFDTADSVETGIFLMYKGIIETVISENIDCEIIITGGSDYIPFEIFRSFSFDKNMLLKAVKELC